MYNNTQFPVCAEILVWMVSNKIISPKKVAQLHSYKLNVKTTVIEEVTDLVIFLWVVRYAGVYAFKCFFMNTTPYIAIV